MPSTLFPIATIFAVLAALVLGGIFVAFLRQNRPFLIIFLLLVICRTISAHDFLMLASAQAAFAIVLGAAKDFLFVAPFLMLTRYKLAKILAMPVAIFLIFLNITDVIYLKETYFRLQQVFFENLDLASILIREDFLAIGVGSILVCLLLFYLLFFKTRTQPLSVKIFLPLATISLLSFSFGLAPQYPKTDDYLTDEINMERNFALVIIADSAVRNVLEEAIWPPPSDDKPLYEYTAEELKILQDYGLLDKKQAKPFKKPAYKRVIYVFVESLSYDFLNCKVLEKGSCTMPYYFSLLEDKKNIFLSNYYSSSFTTDEGIYSAFSSRPDFAGDDFAQRDAETILSLASKKGYKSAYFMGASVYFRSKFKTYINTMKVDEIFGKEQTMDLPPQDHHFQWGDTDERIFEKALIWLKENKKESSVTLICTINTHPPFYNGGISPKGIEDTPLTRAFYATDVALEGFVDGLKKEGILDKDTLLIIGADHQITHGGELALEHLPQNRFGNRHIPLVFVAKNTKPLKGIQKDARASAIDMAPTIGDLLALPEQPTYYGKSLFIPSRRYDLAMTRGGLFFFGTEDEALSFDLRKYPVAPPPVLASSPEVAPQGNATAHTNATATPTGPASGAQGEELPLTGQSNATPESKPQGPPEHVKKEALYKWYFNMQQTAVRK